MATIKDILADKGSHLLCVGAQATALEAALLMNEHKVGCVLVGRPERMEGIFTDRDMLMRVVARRRDPATTRMTPQAMPHPRAQAMSSGLPSVTVAKA